MTFREVQVFLAALKIRTTIHCRKLVSPPHRCQIHHEAPAILAQPTGKQPYLLQQMPDPFWAVDKALAAGSLNAGEFLGDLAHEEFGLALMNQDEDRLKKDGFRRVGPIGY